MLKRLKNLGPGLLVAAAFIGPGTVTTASVAGASAGYASVVGAGVLDRRDDHLAGDERPARDREPGRTRRGAPHHIR